MADLPEATTTLDTEAGALGAGTDYLVIMGAVATAADATPRVFASTKALLSKHGYAPAVDYAALHLEETGKPVIFIGLNAATAGAVSQQDSSGVSGSCVITVTGTPLDECDLELIVTSGGTTGTDAIGFDLSADGGVTYKSVRLGTAITYTIPYLGITLNFSTDATLEVDDTFTCHTSPPRWDQAGIQAARTALAAQLKGARSWLIVGDCATKNDADDVLTEANAYETSNDRFVYARVQLRDQHIAPKKSNVGTLTFAEVGATGDTITRSSGSWIADGFKVGDIITITGAVNGQNNLVGAAIASLTATVITLGADDLVAEAATAGCTVTAPGEDMADWVSSLDATFADIDGEPRIDLAGGRARKLSPITGWHFRRPISWAASIREYQHDVQIPNWRKADGPLSGWDLEDEDGTIVEYDERTQGGLLAARITCARTWSNGPSGTFIALSLTRADESSLLSRTHNMAVADVFQTIVQLETEMAVGQVLELNADGTGTEASLVEVESRVNTALAIGLLQRRVEGPRASGATWSASRTDVLDVPGAELTGTGNLLLNGTIEKIRTRVRVQTAG